MKKLNKLTLITMIFALSFAIQSCEQKQKEPTVEVEKEISKSATIEELGQMNQDFAKALTAKDAVAAAIVYDENASILPPNAPIVTGRANIQAYWQGAIDAGIIDATVKTIDAKSVGNSGYEIGTFTMRFHGAKNDTIVEVGKYTEILKLNKEGKWMAIYGM